MTDDTPGIATDLPDLDAQPLDELADTVRTGDDAHDETLRRVAPGDGTQLLVAASFNSAI